MTDEQAKKRKRDKSTMWLEQSIAGGPWNSLEEVESVAEGRTAAAQLDEGEFRIITVRWQGKLETRKVLTTD